MLKLRSVLIIGVIALPVIVLGYYGYCRYTFDRLGHWGDENEEAYKTGTLSELPGPYLTSGNPSEITFQRIDLGNGWIGGVSEQGDCLMDWFGTKPAEIVTDHPDGSYSVTSSSIGKVTKVFRADGTQQSIPQVCDTQITASGALIVVTGSQGNFKVTRNDKELITISNAVESQLERLKHIYLGGEPTFFVTDEGIISEADDAQVFGKSGSKWTLLDTIPFSRTHLQSTGLGTVLMSHNVDWTKPFLGGTFHFLKDNHLNPVNFPSDVRYPEVVATKNSLIFRDRDKRSKLWKYDGERFSELPIPPDTITFSIDCANSKGDMLLSITRKDPQKQGKQYPYRHSKVFVSNGKWYDFEPILEKVGLSNVVIQTYHGKSTFLDEHGNLFLVLLNHGQTRVVELKRA